MNEQAPDYYRKFRPHVYRLDFDHPVFHCLAEFPSSKRPDEIANCRHAADYISYFLLGISNFHEVFDGYDGVGERPSAWMDYWDNPEFKELAFDPATGRTDRDLTPLEIEISILRNHGRDQFGEVTEYGRLPYLHGLMAMRLMFPKTDITPSLADCAYLVFGAYTYGRKWIHFLGSMDAGKSSSMMRLAFLCQLLDMQNSFSVVGNPLMASAQMTVMGDGFSLHHQLGSAHTVDPDVPELYARDANELKRPRKVEDGASALFPYSSWDARGIIRFDKKLRGKGGWIQLRSFKNKGLAVGSKGDGDFTEGFGWFLLDEINKQAGFDFLEDLENVSGQPWFLGITSQNPRSEQDIGGYFCEPQRWHDWGWGSYNEVRESNPPIWPTRLGGIVYRMNGLESVNMIVGKVVYPYLFNKRKLDGVIERYGEDSPAYKAQVLALFSGADEDMTLISQSQIASSRADLDDYVILRQNGICLSCDPATTGSGDLAVITILRWADCVVTWADGSQKEQELLIADVPQSEVRFEQSRVWDEDGVNELKVYGGSVANITLGTKISYSEQIALKMAELCQKHNIPANCVGYDSSMHPDIVQAVTTVMGGKPEAIVTGSKPIGYQLIETKENTETRSKSRTEEMLFLAADVIKGRSFRGKKHVHTAITQLNQRKILTHKVGQPIEKKLDFKAHSGGISPDFGDSFAYGVGIAYARGFRNRRKGVQGTFRHVLKNRREKRQKRQGFKDLKKR